MANGQVITTGVLNMRRFNQRPVEAMAVGELLDRQVTIIDSGERAEVEDLAIEQTRAREWRVTTLYVRMGQNAKDAGNTLLVPTSAVWTWHQGDLSRCNSATRPDFGFEGSRRRRRAT